MSTVRDLEDLIIESVYLGLVSGKLNQAKKVFEVAEVSGRDVRMTDIQHMLNTLVSWQGTSANVMENIHERIVSANDEHKAAAMKKAAKEKSAEEKFNLIRLALETESEGRKGGMSGYDDQLHALGLALGGQGRKTKGGGHRPGRTG